MTSRCCVSGADRARAAQDLWAVSPKATAVPLYPHGNFFQPEPAEFDFPEFAPTLPSLASVFYDDVKLHTPRAVDLRSLRVDPDWGTAGSGRSSGSSSSGCQIDDSVPEVKSFPAPLVSAPPVPDTLMQDTTWEMSTPPLLPSLSERMPDYQPFTLREMSLAKLDHGVSFPPPRAAEPEPKSSTFSAAYASNGPPMDTQEAPPPRRKKARKADTAPNSRVEFSRKRPRRNGRFVPVRYRVDPHTGEETLVAADENDAPRPGPVIDAPVWANEGWPVF